MPEEVDEMSKSEAEVDPLYNPSMVLEKIRAKIEAIPEDNL